MSSVLKFSEMQFVYCGQLRQPAVREDEGKTGSQ